METSPPPDAASGDELDKARRTIERRGLTGAANNTKWAKLLDVMRTREGWRPSYRYGTIDGYVSGWDAEWWYHVPMPFIMVEWFDIGLVEKVHRGMLLDPREVDHSGWILDVLEDARFDYERSDGFVRIYGYMPSNRDHATTEG